MQTLYQVLGLLGAGLIIWYLYRTVKNRPDMFNRAAMSNSLTTLGILALILIVFVAVLVLILRNT